MLCMCMPSGYAHSNSGYSTYVVHMILCPLACSFLFICTISQIISFSSLICSDYTSLNFTGMGYVHTAFPHVEQSTKQIATSILGAGLLSTRLPCCLITFLLPTNSLVPNYFPSLSHWYRATPAHAEVELSIGGFSSAFQLSQGHNLVLAGQ